MKSAVSRKPAGRRARAKAGANRTRAYAGVLRLASTAADSIDELLRKIDGGMFEQLQAIAVDIETLRREIIKLQPRTMRKQNIPAAGKELDAIVNATETASNRILQCAEEVMAADATDPARYKALVEARMTSIFEACEFQDLTGQRIARIVATLKQIERRVAHFAEASPGERTSRGRSAKGGGNSQAAIDKLLGRRRRR